MEALIREGALNRINAHKKSSLLRRGSNGVLGRKNPKSEMIAAAENVGNSQSIDLLVFCACTHLIQWIFLTPVGAGVGYTYRKR